MVYPHWQEGWTIWDKPLNLSRWWFWSTQAIGEGIYCLRWRKQKHSLVLATPVEYYLQCKTEDLIIKEAGDLSPETACYRTSCSNWRIIFKSWLINWAQRSVPSRKRQFYSLSSFSVPLPNVNNLLSIVLYLFWWGGHCCPMHCDLSRSIVLPRI